MSNVKDMNPRDGAGATAGDEKHVLALVHRSRRGDEAAFGEIYGLFRGRIYGLCLRLTGDPEEAGTLTCDVFVRAWTRLGSFSERGPFGAWLRKVAVNIVIQHRRDEARRNRIIRPDFSRGEDEDDTRPSPNEGRVGPPNTLAAIDLERAIAGLPEGARTIFVLHDVEGFRHREIAEMTGTAVGTTKAQLHRARRLLRGSLDDPREAHA